MVYSDLLKKEVYLLGEGKYLYDIQDFFNELNIKGIIALKKIDSYCSIGSSNKFLIVCDFENSQLKEDLQKIKLENKKDYIFLDILLAMADELETFYITKRHFDKKIIVYGKGKIAEILQENNPNLKIDAFINENTITSLRDLQKGSFYLIVAEEPNLNSKHKFIEIGLEFGRDFHFFNARTPRHLPSFYLKKTIRDVPAYKMNCDYRVKAFSIKKGGFCMACCSSVTLGFGDLLHTSFEEMLLSIPAQIIQLSIKNRTYSFCSDLCFVFRENENKLEHQDDNNYRNSLDKIEIKDLNIQINYDRSCNLACRSCRDHRITKAEDNQETLNLIQEEVIKVAQQKPKNIRVGMGELFFSKYYQDILYNHYKNDSVAIITNGILFNENNWKKLKNRYRNISLEFSIDAAKEETYAYLRGGNFNAVLKALEYASFLRKSGDLQKLAISFVIQNDNFEEMADFVELGRKFSVDKIHFTKINPFGHHNIEEFAKFDVYNNSNKNHQKFVSICSMPCFLQEDIRFDNIKNLLSEAK